jgi:hypothetical protein
MVIQQSMATFFYHAFVSIQPANHSDFFNTHHSFTLTRPRQPAKF